MLIPLWDLIRLNIMMCVDNVGGNQWKQLPELLLHQWEEGDHTTPRYWTSLSLSLLQITSRPPPGTGWLLAGESELVVVAVFVDNNKSGHHVCWWWIVKQKLFSWAPWQQDPVRVRVAGWECPGQESRRWEGGGGQTKVDSCSLAGFPLSLLNVH